MSSDNVVTTTEYTNYNKSIALRYVTSFPLLFRHRITYLWYYSDKLGGSDVLTFAIRPPSLLVEWNDQAVNYVYHRLKKNFVCKDKLVEVHEKRFIKLQLSDQGAVVCNVVLLREHRSLRKKFLYFDHLESKINVNKFKRIKIGLYYFRYARK